MRKLILLAGSVALAVSVPVIAQGQGRGQDRGAEQRGGKQDRADRRGRGGEQGGEARRQRRGERGDASRGGRAERREAREARQEVRQARGEARREARDLRRERREDVREARREARDLRRERREDVREARRESRRAIARDRRDLRRAAREDRRDWRGWIDRRPAPFVVSAPLRVVGRDGFVPGRAVGWRGACPPGLARQNAWCLPPGQLRRLQASAYNIPLRYRYRFADGGDLLWRYDENGLVYGIGRGDGLVERVVPLYATDLFVGAPLPLGYEVYNVPFAYRSFYPDSGDYLYRYDDGGIYRVDEGSGLIDAIVALLTAGVGGLGGLAIGDTLPLGYDVYNVPLAYRDDYVDRDDAWYRYADGAIYEVDPQTRLIEQIIPLLA